MHRSAVPDRLLFAVLAVLALPTAGSAQLRDVVGKQVSVGATDATLVLEFRGGDRLDVALRDGSVTVDGRTLGTFEPGGALDAAWRSLLGQAVALENGPLAVALRDWTPPAGLTGTAAETARALDRALEEALAAAAAPAAAPGVSVSVRNGAETALGRLLLGSGGRLSVIEEALRGLDSGISLHIGEDLEVPAGETVEGTMVVIDGDARISGTVRGDLVVVDGTVSLEDGSQVTGQLRVADSRILRNEGVVAGGVIDVLATERSEMADLRDRLRSELQTQITDQVRRDLERSFSGNARSARDDRRPSIFSPFRSLVRGIGGLIEKVFLVLVLGLLGAAAVTFARPNFDIVAEAARKAPGRAAAVGLAGTFLLIPVWILGAVALVVSIVGIPVAIAWLPLFPAAVVVAVIFGYLAVARNAGEWLAESGYAWTDWVRPTNPVHTIVAGLIGLVAAFAVADVVSILPFFGFVSGLLIFLGSLLTFMVVQIGFGAVILTRGGRRREYRHMDPDEAWAAAMDLDDDDLDADFGTGSRRTAGARGAGDAANADAGGTPHV